MINVHHLKYFVDAAANESISRSAKINFVSQSAVSRAIQNLESSLDAKLVIHGRNRFQLTEVGQAIFAESRSIFSALEALKHSAESFSKTYRGQLSFACNQAIASHLVGPVLPNLAQKYPGLHINLRLGNTDQVQRMLEQREVDFGIVLNDGEVSKNFVTEDFFKDHFVVVRSPKLQSKFDGSDVIVSRTVKGGMSQLYEKGFRKEYGKAFLPKLTIPSWQVIRDLAIAGNGSALVPRFICLSSFENGELKEVKHRVKPLPFSLSTVVSQNRRLPKNAKALLDELK